MFEQCFLQYFRLGMCIPRVATIDGLCNLQVLDVMHVLLLAYVHSAVLGDVVNLLITQLHVLANSCHTIIGTMRDMRNMHKSALSTSTMYEGQTLNADVGGKVRATTCRFLVCRRSYGSESSHGAWMGLPIGPKVVPFWDYLIEF